MQLLTARVLAVQRLPVEGHQLVPVGLVPVRPVAFQPVSVEPAAGAPRRAGHGGWRRRPGRPGESGCPRSGWGPGWMVATGRLGTASTLAVAAAADNPTTARCRIW
ncbi:MAG: hypothetical protein VKO65_06210 [Cyanobacteriota bacterium]|nr:hypothetical protein [Cyanobacteriota bacterium]